MLTKRLKMDADVYVEKSFEEVLEDFRHIKRSYIKKLCTEYKQDNGYDEDDIDSICNMYIWKAYKHYSNTEVSFPHYLKIVLQRGMNTEMLKFRRGSEKVVSLNKKMKLPSGETEEYLDLIPGVTNQEYIVVNLLAITKVVDDSIEKHRDIFNEYFYQDMNCREIAKKHDMKPDGVSKIIYKMKGKMKN